MPTKVVWIAVRCAEECLDSLRTANSLLFTDNAKMYHLGHVHAPGLRATATRLYDDGPPPGDPGNVLGPLLQEWARLCREKEDWVNSQEFEKAAECRSRADSVWEEINRVAGIGMQAPVGRVTAGPDDTKQGETAATADEVAESAEALVASYRHVLADVLFNVAARHLL